MSMQFAHRHHSLAVGIPVPGLLDKLEIRVRDKDRDIPGKAATFGRKTNGLFSLHQLSSPIQRGNREKGVKSLAPVDGSEVGG